jgi:hypothetical protein
MGISGSILPQISLIAWNRLSTIPNASLGILRSAFSYSYIISPILVVVQGLSSNYFLNLNEFYLSGRWAMPIKHMKPTLNTQWPPLTPSKKLALRVAILLSIYKSNQMRAQRGSSTSEASCLLICSGKASMLNRGKSVLMWPRKELKALPLTLIT